MLPPLRPGATQYQDLLKTGFVPTATSPSDGLIQEVFNLYYNPALSVIGDEIVGLADIDLFGGLGDNSGSGMPYFFGPPGSGLLQNGSGQFLGNQAISMYGWSSIGSSSYHALQVSLRKQPLHRVPLVTPEGGSNRGSQWRRCMPDIRQKHGFGDCIGIGYGKHRNRTLKEKSKAGCINRRRLLDYSIVRMIAID